MEWYCQWNQPDALVFTGVLYYHAVRSVYALWTPVRLDRNNIQSAPSQAYHNRWVPKTVPRMKCQGTPQRIGTVGGYSPPVRMSVECYWRVGLISLKVVIDISKVTMGSLIFWDLIGWNLAEIDPLDGFVPRLHTRPVGGQQWILNLILGSYGRVYCVSEGKSTPTTLRCIQESYS